MAPGPRRRPRRALVDRPVAVPERCCQRRARCVPCWSPPPRRSQPTKSWRDRLMEPPSAAWVHDAKRAHRRAGPWSRRRPATVNSSGTPRGLQAPRQAEGREGRFGFGLVRAGKPHGGGRVCGCWSRPVLCSQPGGRGRPRPRSRTPRGCPHRGATHGARYTTYFLRWTPARWLGAQFPAAPMTKYRATSCGSLVEKWRSL
jgi:hypothetical protein